MAGVLGAGVLQGALIGVVLSMALLLRRASRPGMVELGRIPDTDLFADRQRDPQFAVEPGVLVVRIEGALLYFNIEHVQGRILQLLAGRQEITLAVIHLASVPMVDLAGAEFLLELHEELGRQGIELVPIEARGHIRDALRRAGYALPDGTTGPQRSIAQAIAHWAATRPVTS